MFASPKVNLRDTSERSQNTFPSHKIRQTGEESESRRPFFRSLLDSVGPVQYHPHKTANTRPADAALIQRASRFPKKLLRHESRVSQHAIDRFLGGERIHPGTRKKVAQIVEELERMQK